MTKKELISKLLEIAERNGSDYEVVHSEADDALLEYINDTEVTKTFEELGKWYS